MLTRRSAVGGLGSALVLINHGHGEEPLPNQLNMFVPGNAGGGLDRVAQALARSAKAAATPIALRFDHAPGESGLTGLARFLARKGQASHVLVAGLSIMGVGLVAKPVLRLGETTPLLRLPNEALMIVVPRGSPFKRIDDVLAAMLAEPERIVVTGSAVGGADHLLFAALALASGIDLRRLSYFAASALGLTRIAALDEKASCAIGSFRDFEAALSSGQVRALAATDTMSGVPSFGEVGIQLDFESWRGLFVPPNTSVAQKNALAGWFERLFALPDWENEVLAHGWSLPKASSSFSLYVEQEEAKLVRLARAMGIG